MYICSLHTFSDLCGTSTELFHGANISILLETRCSLGFLLDTFNITEHGNSKR